MVHTLIVPRLPIVEAAAALVDLEFVPGAADRWDHAPFVRPGEPDPTPAGPQTGVLRVPGGIALGFNRPAARVGVFGTGPVALVWDDHREGWGLTARIGSAGLYLVQALAITEIDQFCTLTGATCRQHARADGSLRFHLQSKEGTVPAQPEVVVNVSPEGKATIEVNGCTGAACENLTAALESALGTVTSNERKPEFHRPVTETVKVGQG